MACQYVLGHYNGPHSLTHSLTDRISEPRAWVGSVRLDDRGFGSFQVRLGRLRWASHGHAIGLGDLGGSVAQCWIFGTGCRVAVLQARHTPAYNQAGRLSCPLGAHLCRYRVLPLVRSLSDATRVSYSSDTHTFLSSFFLSAIANKTTQQVSLDICRMLQPMYSR